MRKLIEGIILIVAFIFMTALVANRSYAETLKVDNTRLVNILGDVDFRILAKANEILKLSTASTKPIYLLINSPGGSVAAGSIFIDSMNLIKKKGIKIKCLSTIYNASMAFSIFATCSERYALPNTSLLFHPVRIGLEGMYREMDLTPIATSLGKIDSILQTFLVESTAIDKEIMMKAYYEEKWWTALELKTATKQGWLTIIDGLVGIEDPFIIEELDGSAHGMELLPNFIHGD